MNERETAQKIAQFLAEHKGEDIQILDVTDATVIADYFVICTGKNPLHVHALCDDLEEKMSALGFEPRRREGLREGRWAVLDYGSSVVHVFAPQEREFYHLERLWNTGNNLVLWEE